MQDNDRFFNDVAKTIYEIGLCSINLLIHEEKIVELQAFMQLN